MKHLFPTTLDDSRMHSVLAKSATQKLLLAERHALTATWGNGTADYDRIPNSSPEEDAWCVVPHVWATVATAQTPREDRLSHKER